MKIKSFNLIFIFLFIVSCASIGEEKENYGGEAIKKFRYINLNIIFDYLTVNDPESKALKKRREETIQKLEDVTLKLYELKDGPVRDDYNEKQKQYRTLLATIKKDEEHYKSEILNQINRALENIAGKSDIDFVFNIGEGAVYAKKEYDITEEVLREIIKIKERSAPVSR